MELNSTSMIKKEAKLLLSSGNWNKSVIITIILIAVSLLTNICNIGSSLFFRSDLRNWSFAPPHLGIGTGFSLAVTILLMFPLSYGILKWFYDTSKGESKEISGIFNYFTSLDQYGRGLHGSILVWLAVAAFSIVYCILAAMAMSISLFLLEMSGQAFYQTMTFSTERMSAISISFVIIATVVTVTAALIMITYSNYFLVPYIMAEEPGKSPGICFKESKEIMKGHRWHIIKLWLSFVLWGVACLFILPILYVYPYISMSNAVVAREILKNRVEKVIPEIIG